MVGSLSNTTGLVNSNYGYLPEGMNNYLARLGWSHGDDELFTIEQMVSWFDGSHLNRSPAQWDAAKLLWVNAHHMKQADDARLAALVVGQLARRGISAQADDAMAARCALLKDRCQTTVELADWIEMFHAAPTPAQADLDQVDVAYALAADFRELLRDWLLCAATVVLPDGNTLEAWVLARCPELRGEGGDDIAQVDAARPLWPVIAQLAHVALRTLEDAARELEHDAAASGQGTQSSTG